MAVVTIRTKKEKKNEIHRVFQFQHFAFSFPLKTIESSSVTPNASVLWFSFRDFFPIDSNYRYFWWVRHLCRKTTFRIEKKRRKNRKSCKRRICMVKRVCIVQIATRSRKSPINLITLNVQIIVDKYTWRIFIRGIQHVFWSLYIYVNFFNVFDLFPEIFCQIFPIILKPKFELDLLICWQSKLQWIFINKKKMNFTLNWKEKEQSFESMM